MENWRALNGSQGTWTWTVVIQLTSRVTCDKSLPLCVHTLTHSLIKWKDLIFWMLKCNMFRKSWPDYDIIYRLLTNDDIFFSFCCLTASLLRHSPWGDMEYVYVESFRGMWEHVQSGRVSERQAEWGLWQPSAEPGTARGVRRWEGREVNLVKSSRYLHREG